MFLVNFLMKVWRKLLINFDSLYKGKRKNIDIRWFVIFGLVFGDILVEKVNG